MTTTQKLIEALVKIAAENDEWGPFPEANNPAWGPMAIVEARTALKEYRTALAAAKQPAPSVERQAEPVAIPETFMGEPVLMQQTAQPAPEVPSAPEGWKLVPIEPTPEMLNADFEMYAVGSGLRYKANKRNLYAAMLASAPSTAPKETK